MKTALQISNQFSFLLTREKITMSNLRKITFLFILSLTASAAALADPCLVSAVRDGNGTIRYQVSKPDGQVFQTSYQYNEAVTYAENDVLNGYCTSVENNVGSIVTGYPTNYIYYPYYNGVYFLPGYRPGYFPYGYRPGFYYPESYYRGYGCTFPIYYGAYRNGRYSGYDGRSGGERAAYRDGFHDGYHSQTRVNHGQNGGRGPVNRPNNGGGSHGPVNRPNNGGGSHGPVNRPNNGGGRAPTSRPSNGGGHAPSRPSNGGGHAPSRPSVPSHSSGGGASHSGGGSRGGGGGHGHR
jgi:hypothetical protein